MASRDQLLEIIALRATAERYAMAVDRRDVDMFVAQFTPDEILEAPRGRFVGYEELAGVPPMMKRLYQRTHHGVVGMVPVITGDRATAQTNAIARHYYCDGADVEHCYAMTIRYDDTFRAIDDKWLIESRRLVLVGDTTFATGRRPGATDNATSIRETKP